MTDRAYRCAFVALLGCVACDGGDTRAVDEPLLCNSPEESFADPELLYEGLIGSEDIAISAKGDMIARKGAAVVRVLEDGETEEIVPDFPGSTGMRFIDDESLAVGNYVAGTVVRLGLDGSTEDLITGLPGANGVFVDVDGRVWATGSALGTSNGKVVVREADGEIRDVATGLMGPNGVAYDSTRNAVFFNELPTGIIWRVDLDEDGNFGEKVEVATLPTSALPDGQTFDACGNLYVVSFGGRKLFRVLLRADGSAKYDPEEIAAYPSDDQVANPVFARSRDPSKIYVTGALGNVYSLDVGITAAKNAP